MVGQTEKLSPEEETRANFRNRPKNCRKVSVRHGPFGPHAMIGSKDDPKEAGKPKSMSFKKRTRYHNNNFGRGSDLFVLPRLLGETPDGEHITACLGRFGPYLNYGEKKKIYL